MGFFKKESITEDENISISNEINNTTCDTYQTSHKNSFRRDDLSLFYTNDIEYVINNFPSMSIEIRNSLNNLAETLEDTINFIEDKSSEIIKDSRDFKLSQAHRDTSIAIYDVVENIRESITEDENISISNEINNTTCDTYQTSHKNSFRRDDLSLFYTNDIEYVINNFPSMSIEIRNSLNNLAETLEDTINFIEDKSSEIIKDSRDFKLSQAHRDTSIAIYDVVENIREYIDWMKDEYEKKINKADENSEKNNVELEKIVDKELVDEDNNVEIEIFKDLTLIEPKGFRLKENLVKVDDWNDLLVKTAEILNRQYKNNKNSNKKLGYFIIDDKKSEQNSFRDTAIEMLNEYKIGLDEFIIIS